MSDNKMPNEPFTPKIVAFFCNWCTYTAADLAGTARMQYAPNVRVVRITAGSTRSSCSRRCAKGPTAS